VVAGDFDPAQAKVLVSKYFSGIPKGEPVKQPMAVEPPLEKEVRDIIYDRIQLPAVVQGYRIPANGTPDFYAVEMVNRLLSNGNASRLNRSLKDEQQKAVYTGAFSLPFEHPGLAILYAIANAGVDATDLERAMDAELHRIQKEGVGAEEFAKLLAQLETEAIQDNSRVAGVAGNLATAHMLLGNTALVNKELERYLALTPADLQRAAQTYFSTDRRVVLHYLPMNQKPQ
jgi:predicted Zn-dependent peptidase